MRSSRHPRNQQSLDNRLRTRFSEQIYSKCNGHKCRRHVMVVSSAIATKTPHIPERKSRLRRQWSGDRLPAFNIESQRRSGRNTASCPCVSGVTLASMPAVCLGVRRGCCDDIVFESKPTIDECAGRNSAGASRSLIGFAEPFDIDAAARHLEANITKSGKWQNTRLTDGCYRDVVFRSPTKSRIRDDSQWWSLSPVFSRCMRAICRSTGSSGGCQTRLRTLEYGLLGRLPPQQHATQAIFRGWN